MSQENNNLSLSDFLSILQYRRKTIILFTLLITSIVGVYAFIAPQVFSSSTTLMPPEQRGASGLSAMLQSAIPALPLNLGGGSATNLTTNDVLTSNAIADCIYNENNLSKSVYFQGKAKGEIIGIIRNSILIDNKRSGVTAINVSLPTKYIASEAESREVKKLVAIIANGVPAALDKIMREKSSSTAKKTRQFIERVITVQQKNLDSVQSTLQAFQEKNKIVGIDAQTQAMVTNSVGLGTELAKMELQLALAQQEYNTSAPIIKTLQNQISTISEQMQRVQSGGMVSFDKTTIAIDSIPSLTKQYINLIRDQKILEQINMYLQTQRLQELIQEEKDIPSVQVLDSAFEPIERSSPKRSLMIIMGGLVSFLCTCGCVFFYSVMIQKNNKQ